MKKTVIVSLLGTQLDAAGRNKKRQQRWRPNVSLVKQPELQVDEVHLIYDPLNETLAHTVVRDMEISSPTTNIVLHAMHFANPWDFEEVYAGLYDFCHRFPFDIDHHHYLFHITTGTHVVQICGFLLTESRHFPGRLLQTAPDKDAEDKSIGKTQIIDLDLSRYDQLANRFLDEHHQGETFLKGGIETKNVTFNKMITQIEKVAIRSRSPILLTGPTGAGKSQLASRIYQLKKKVGTLSGQLVVVNCATLKGENAMAALFGHTKGAFTGAAKARNGFLCAADNGMLFLDEVGELGLEEQAMLLRAIENKSFHPVGSDQEVTSDFQLIAGTNRDLKACVRQGMFREDLLARINLWTYPLPALKDRKEDLAANIEYELERFTQQQGRRVRFNKEALREYLTFAQSAAAVWRGNFRDLSSSITRLCTLADSARIAVSDVEDERQRLLSDWQDGESNRGALVLGQLFPAERIEQLDCFDRHQLEFVLEMCLQSSSMAAAGRVLFNVSRTQKSTRNDSSRLQKYLTKFGLRWEQIKAINHG